MSYHKYNICLKSVNMILKKRRYNYIFLIINYNLEIEMLSDGRIEIGRIRSVKEWDARAGTRGQGPARSLLTANSPSLPAPPLALPPQVQGWRGARHGAVRGSPARASVVSPHYYRYVSASLRSSPRELEARSQ